VLELGQDLGAAGRFLVWPRGIVRALDGTPVVGVAMDRVPSPPFDELERLILSPVSALAQFRQGRTWSAYLKMARATAAAVRTMHGLGMGHGDLKLQNVKADAVSGEIRLLDLDSPVVRGYLAPEVQGSPRFIAPEILMHSGEAGILADRHSLAVLILWTLLFRDVMEPRRCYDVDDMARSDRLGYGEFACFSENPTDRRNWAAEIGRPLFARGALSYRCLPPRLQELTVQALVTHLHDPEDRPQASEWEQALADTYDALLPCPTCHLTICYPYWIAPATRRLCPFCGQPVCGDHVNPPYPAVLELKEPVTPGVYSDGRAVVLDDGYALYADVVEPRQRPPFTRRGAPTIGTVAWDRVRRVHCLTNTGDQPWRVIGAEGARQTIVRAGEAVALQKGLLLDFGYGKRRARVLE